MLFTYYFLTNKLDLAIFRKQATHYTAVMREIAYHLYLPDYKITVEIAKDDNDCYVVCLWLSELERDEYGEIDKDGVIFPLSDNRFQDIKFIQDLFPIDNYKSISIVHNISETIDKICELTKLMFKINNFKTFI